MPLHASPQFVKSRLTKCFDILNGKKCVAFMDNTFSMVCVIIRCLDDLNQQQESRFLVPLLVDNISESWLIVRFYISCKPQPICTLACVCVYPPPVAKGLEVSKHFC